VEDRIKQRKFIFSDSMTEKDYEDFFKMEETIEKKFRNKAIRLGYLFSQTKHIEKLQVNQKVGIRSKEDDIIIILGHDIVKLHGKDVFGIVTVWNMKHPNEFYFNETQIVYDMTRDDEDDIIFEQVNEYKKVGNKRIACA
jgi:hypothetical protein